MIGSSPWRDATRDLLFGVACLGCGVGGSPWCRECRARWQRGQVMSVEDHVVGDNEIAAAAPYRADLRLAIVAHKERSMQSLAPALGGLLAQPLFELVGPPMPGILVILVPVPSTPRAVRTRGYDATASLTRQAARVLRRTGHRVVVSSALRMRPGTLDQAGLGRAERRENLHRAMRVSRLRLWWLRRHSADATWLRVIVCDDICTTGATLREAVRALIAGGMAVDASAVIAVAEAR